MPLKRAADDAFEGVPAERPPKVLKSSEQPKKHSLDSDEEDSGEEGHERYEILDDDDIEGQEEGVSGQDGEVKITPFNMKEELEEGHFDTEGNYHWNKDDDIKDSWLDNIDWVQVRAKPAGKSDLDDTMDSASESPFDMTAVYRQMLEHMQPGETVTRALKRLGGGGTLSASERLKRKKAGLSCDSSGDSSKVTELTELANRILTKTGNMNIYQETYSHINGLVNSGAGTSKDYDDALDMYADDFDVKEKQRINHQDSSTSEPNKEAEMNFGETLMWEYKLEKNTDAVQGPHTTEQMQKYVNEGFFKSEIWVRKVGQEGPFYSSRRVDFDIYL